MEKSRPASPLWHQALERYREELQGNGDYESIQSIHSLEELIGSLSTIHIAAPNTYTGVTFLNRLAPRLKFVDDFSAVLALCFGADAALTAAVWGSIRLILSHASSASETLQDVLDMLEELSLTLPRFQVYEKTLPLDRQLQRALVDVYTETICFYARAIHFLQSNPHLVLRKNAWQSFRNDFSRTILRIKRMSSTVESEADLARMRKDELQYREVLELLSTMRASKTESRGRVRYNNIPFAPNPGFSGREGLLQSLETSLDPEQVASEPKSLALFGMGGVGKTQVALQYAYHHVETFDVVLWICADNAISMDQSCRTAAEGLGLLRRDDEAKDRASAVFKIKTWLNTTQSTCLVIFDNADDLSSLKTAWPGASRGSILLTTRNFTVATSLAVRHEQIQSLTEVEGRDLLLRSLQVLDPSESDKKHALAISETLGGLPLALSQIAGFMKQRKLPLKDFLSLYQRYPDRIDARKAPGSDYEHTLNTVWNVSFEKLTESAHRLLAVLAFMSPDGISEELLLKGSHGLEEDFLFLSDEMDLGDASEELLQAALISRQSDSATLAVHRLIQSAARKRHEHQKNLKHVDAVVHILCWSFPDHASADVGHQIATWDQCEKGLPHVDQLVRLTKNEGWKAGQQQKFASLLLRCSWHLYEREMYFVARQMVEQAISIFDDETSLEYASAIDLGGLIDLDLARPQQALDPFRKALEIRKAKLGPEDPFVSFSLNNIALAYTEMNELASAYSAHEEAIRLRLRAKSDRIGNSYSNMSSLLLRMGRPDEAEEMLARCPSLKDFTDETFLATGNPRFSGDMVLLSRIRLAQNRPSDALRLASKALAFRRSLLGNKLKTCDSQYDVACMLLEQSHVSSAVQMLEEVVSISESFVEGEGQRARALYKLSGIYVKRGVDADASACRERALALRERLRPDLKDAPFEEEEFRKLCLWMLW